MIKYSFIKSFLDLESHLAALLISSSSKVVTVVRQHCAQVRQSMVL
jgi:hypothetical protein